MLESHAFSTHIPETLLWLLVEPFGLTHAILGGRAGMLSREVSHSRRS